MTSVPAEIFDHPIVLSRGLNAKDFNWKPFETTVGKFVEQKFLRPVEVGAKDGLAWTQGKIVGGRRLAAHVEANWGLFYDVDTGESLSSLIQRFEATGYLTILMPTYSHLTTTSKISEKEMTRWARREGLDLENKDELRRCAADYLKSEKGVVPEIADEIEDVTRGLGEGGVAYIVTHPPMPKYRALMFLEEPFSFVEGGTQAERIAEWKAGYLGGADALGLVIDEKCQDPSRLLYAPRRPEGSDASLWKATIIPGGLVPWSDIPQREPAKKAATGRVMHNVHSSDPLERAVARAMATDKPEKEQFSTPGLARFLAKYGKSFQAATWLEAAGADVRAHKDEGKIECECPLDEMHSNAGDPDDRGFFAVDAEEGAARPWTMFCNHATCSGHTGGDRAKYLDAACQKYGVEDARELMEWVVGAETEGAAEAVAEDLADDVDAAIDAADPRNIDPVLRAIAKAGGDVGLIESRIEALAKRTKVSKTVIRRSVERYAKEETRATTSSNDVPVRDAHPVPDDPASARTIWLDWDYQDQIRVTMAALEDINNKDPQLFARARGIPVRLRRGPDELVFEELYNSDQWSAEIGKRLTFKAPATETEPSKTKSPPGEIVSFVKGSGDLALPYIERIVEVPVFNGKGELLIEEGYDEDSATYLSPRGEFLPVPDVVTDDDVEEACYWIGEALRDFPFSDEFTGSDPLPVRVPGQVDGDGFPLPNYARGVSSRANAFAMILQPFARALINGPTPAYLLDKSAPGTGAGFLANVVGYILYGTTMPTAPASKNDEEFAKALGAALRDGGPTIFFDNIKHKVENADFPLVLTSGEWRGRILGTSDIARVKIKTMWMLAANAGTFHREIMRRIVPIRIDAALEDPSRARPPEFFKYDVDEFCAEHRAKLVWSCHVLIRNWVQAGRPQGKVPMASFTGWYKTMGGILGAAGIPGFLDNVDAYMSNRGDEGEKTTALVEMMLAAYGPNVEMDFAMVVGVVADPQNPERVNSELGLMLPSRLDDKAFRSGLGLLLRGMVGATFNTASHGAVNLQAYDGRGRKKVYKVVPVAA